MPALDLETLYCGPRLPLPTERDLERNRVDPVAYPLRFPTDDELTHSDGEPMETPWHRDNMHLLLDSIHTRWADREDFYAGGNMFIYFGNRPVFNRDFRGPDFFVVAHHVERRKPRRSWVAWREWSRLPDLIVELASPSTADIDRTIKKELYATRFRTREYFLYDPDSDTLEGWRLPGHMRGYEAISPDEFGRLRSDVLGCSLGTWDGEYAETTARWLRMFEADGRLAATHLEMDDSAVPTVVFATGAELAALRPPTP